jgi:hypothetical protein
VLVVDALNVSGEGLPSPGARLLLDTREGAP